MIRNVWNLRGEDSMSNTEKRQKIGYAVIFFGRPSIRKKIMIAAIDQPVQIPLTLKSRPTWIVYEDH